LPFPTELKLGLLERGGDYGEALNCVIAMERNDFDGIEFMALCSPWRFDSEGQLSR
jgi:hypothetical protein